MTREEKINKLAQFDDEAILRCYFTGRKDEIFCIRDGQKLTYDEVFGG